jgi:hypothetical protein
MSAEADHGRTAPPAGRMPLPPVAPPRPTVPPPPVAPPRPAAAPRPAVAPPARPTGPPPAGPLGRLPAGPSGHGPDLAGPPTVRLRPLTDENGPHPEPSGLRPAARTAAAAACLVLGVGLLGGAAAGSLIGDDTPGAAAVVRFDHARELWHTLPVDTLFPRTLEGENAGPGGADRTWIRVGVAPDSGCKDAFDPLLAKVLSPVGCARLIRATYADETSTSVTTVGIVFTRADPRAMKDLHRRFAHEHLGARPDMMPRAFPVRGTVAADFSDAQRASWSIHVLTDVPAVVYTVTAFADGRPVSDPQPAAEAVRKGETSAPAQAGLGNDAAGIADLTQQTLHEKAVRGKKENAQ